MTFKVAVLGTRGYPSFYGGFETAVRHLAPHLANNDIDVTVYSRPRDVSVTGNFDSRVKVINTRGVDSKSLSTLSYGFTSAISAMRHKPDVALVMNVANGYFLPLLRNAGIRTLVNVDGIEWERAKWGRLGRHTFRLGAELTAKYADDIVCDSLELVTYWRKEFGRDGIFIPYGGVHEPALPTPLNLTSGSYLLYVARMVPENNVELFARVAARVAARRPVVIIGAGAEGSDSQKRVQELAARHHNVQWLGQVSDDKLLHGLWQNAGAYFHGHSVGGTNPALVQAMHLGAPTVAFDTAFNREVLGDLGLYVESDVTALETAIESLFSLDESDRRSLGESLKARAEEHYSWHRINEMYREALTRLYYGGTSRMTGEDK